MQSTIGIRSILPGFYPGGCRHLIRARRFLTFILLSCSLLPGLLLAAGHKKIKFASLDGLPISADIYHSKTRKKGFILLCHQASYSRGEYRPIAPLLTKMGFNLMAIDQRSGQRVKGITNETAKRAYKRGLKTDYLSAKQDILAAIAYISKKIKPRKLILWGSSYSAALVLKIAGEQKYRYHGVVAFSPGEYFGAKNFIGRDAKKIRIPVWITSSKSEVGRTKKFFAKIGSHKKVFFIPKERGAHGSKALWKAGSHYKEYRKSLFTFLNRI